MLRSDLFQFLMDFLGDFSRKSGFFSKRPGFVGPNAFFMWKYITWAEQKDQSHTVRRRSIFCRVDYIFVYKSVEDWWFWGFFFEKIFFAKKLFLCSEYFVRLIVLVMGTNSGIKCHFDRKILISFEWRFFLIFLKMAVSSHLRRGERQNIKL